MDMDKVLTLLKQELSPYTVYISLHDRYYSVRDVVKNQNGDYVVVLGKPDLPLGEWEEFTTLALRCEEMFGIPCLYYMIRDDVAGEGKTLRLAPLLEEVSPKLLALLNKEYKGRWFNSIFETYRKIGNINTAPPHAAAEYDVEVELIPTSGRVQEAINQVDFERELEEVYNVKPSYRISIKNLTD